MLENLGPRIREIRKEKGMTLVEIAAKTGIAQATLSRIETGTMIGTVESHAKIAEILGVGLADFYSGVDARQEKTAHRSRPAAVTHHDKNFSIEQLIPENGKKKMLPFLVTLQAGGKTPAESLSAGREKFVYVLEGELTANIDGKDYPLKPGETLYFEASLPHFFRSSGGKSVKLLASVSA